MIHLGWWLTVFTTAVVLWQECGENPALFCYRIGWGTFSGLRSRTLAPIRLSARNESFCWNPSATCSTRFTTSKE
jgi:hypothetical protein